MSTLSIKALENLQNINGAAFARNKIVNPNFAVNQLALSGTVNLAAGAFGHDQWKAGPAGCTYTFSTANNVTTLNITAGTLQQTMEGANLFSGMHTLSWQGTAQGRIGAGAYGASGQQATITGGTDTTVEFGIGTLALVQFEPGAYASLCEVRHPQIELAVCQRYYEIGRSWGVSYASSGAAFQRITHPMKVTKRATPTCTVAYIGGTASSPVVANQSTDTILFAYNATAASQDILVSFTAAARL